MNKALFLFKRTFYCSSFYVYVLLLVLILFGYSCKSVERIFVGEASTEINEKKLIKNVISKDIVYDNIFFKRVQYDFDFEGQSRSLKGNLYISKDKHIVMSITPLLGIELYRIVLEPNQVSIIDRINKKVILTNYSYLKKKYLFDLDYFLFQDILTNSFFTYPYNLPFPDTRFKGAIANNMYTLQTLSKASSSRISSSITAHQQVIHIIPDLFKVASTTIILPEDQTIFKVNYSNFKSFESNIQYPSNIEMEGSHISDKIRVMFNFSQLELNSKQSVSPNIPDSYEKVYY